MADDPAAQARAGYVEALKVEREGYVRAGKADRVAQVDAEIRKAGGAPPKGRRSATKDEA